MRAIVINPYDCTITEIEHDGTLEGMYRTIKCGTVCTFELSRRDTLWLDDNGMLSAGKPVWRWMGVPQPFAGMGLILGTTRGGNNTSAGIGLEVVSTAVSWTDEETTGEFSSGSSIDGPLNVNGMDFDFAVVGGAPILRKREAA